MLSDAKAICLEAINGCLPDEGVRAVLEDYKYDDVYLLAAGKAAFSMAAAAAEKVKIRKGVVISKYGHIKGEIENCECYEAGHPVSDAATIQATEAAIGMLKDLKEDDHVLFLLSGGASALFEKPLISLEKLRHINEQMLKKGLNIVEINTIRKKLSAVKGGKLAELCRPAQVTAIILSDVLSDRLDVIGSGPTVEDKSTAEDALELVRRYDLDLSDETLKIISESRSCYCDNCENIIIGSVRILCEKAMAAAKKYGYEPILITDHIDTEATEAGDLLYDEMMKHLDDPHDTALIMGGETIVHVKGNGLGGRNQELVFSQIKKLDGMDNVLMMSLGSDGTDGPTDAAGGYVDGSSYQKLKDKGLDYEKILADNDSYHGLKAIDGLIVTGPTGTNVNDITLALIRKKKTA